MANAAALHHFQPVADLCARPPATPTRPESASGRLHGREWITGILGWTIASLVTAGASGSWPDRLMLAGPVIMGIALMMIALLLPSFTVTLVLVPAIVALGGIGQCWPFVGHRIMSGAKAGDEDVAASSIPTVQQTGPIEKD